MAEFEGAAVVGCVLPEGIVETSLVLGVDEVDDAFQVRIAIGDVEVGCDVS